MERSINFIDFFYGLFLEVIVFDTFLWRVCFTYINTFIFFFKVEIDIFQMISQLLVYFNYTSSNDLFTLYHEAYIFFLGVV